MCFHFSLAVSKETLEKNFSRSLNISKYSKKHFINGFVFPELIIIKPNEQENFQIANWGLIPSWIKDTKKASEIRKMTLNAKSETVFEKPSFKNAIQKKRCLIPADGFFEWRNVNKNKYPYFIFSDQSEVFCFGGIFETWINNESGEIIDTVSIITTPANELLSLIHNDKKRMPLIIPKENQNQWLDLTIKQDDITKLMQPLPDGLLKAHSIAKLSLNDSVKNEEIKKYFAYWRVNINY